MYWGVRLRSCWGCEPLTSDMPKKGGHMNKTNVFNLEEYKKRGLSEESIERLRGALAEPLLSEIEDIFAGKNKLGVAKRDRIELVLDYLRALGIDQSI